MPIQPPTLDDRLYQDLLDEALARIPVHNPEWTNFNKSDPGVTLLELLAFYMESLHFRCNQVPDRLRLRHLNLLHIGLLPAASARGLVTITNERGPLQAVTLASDLEVSAGSVPFRTTMGLDVLPIEARAFARLKVRQPGENMLAYYRELYASYGAESSGSDLSLYQTVPLPTDDGRPLGLADTVDGLLWIALFARPGEDASQARSEIKGRVLSLGVVPSVPASVLEMRAGRAGPGATNTLGVEIPKLPSDPDATASSIAYVPLECLASTDLLTQPGVLQVILPPDAEALWAPTVDPLEAGAGEFPPELDDEDLAGRLITWMRLRPQQRAGAAFHWIGLNATPVQQRVRVLGERLPAGSGEPDQVARLANASIVKGSVRLRVTTTTGSEEWQEAADLLEAGPEVRVPDLRLPPSTVTEEPADSRKFALEAEAGELRFGDGLRGRRPPGGAEMEVDYDYTRGAEGNVGLGAIKSGVFLPAGFKVTNPVRAWGGVAAQSVADGEKQIAALVQNRDRLVTEEDYRIIARRTPDADVGRAEALSAWSAETPGLKPGMVPGVVTVMLVPKADPDHPDTPEPTPEFLDAVCRHLDPRRLVTTEVKLTGPDYVPILVSVGFQPAPGVSEAEVRDRVRAAVQQFLSPLPAAAGAALDRCELSFADDYRGWPLAKQVNANEIAAVLSRQKDVLYVTEVLLSASPATDAVPKITLDGIQLPRLAGLRVSIGDPAPLADLLGPVTPTGTPRSVVPVPIVPEEC
jgi:hypothetical protein